MPLTGSFDFGEYWRCINGNSTSDSGFDSGLDANGEQIVGSVTCGWTGVSAHDECESSISILKANTASQDPLIPWSQLNASSQTTELVTTTTYSTCPAQTSAYLTSSSPDPTSTSNSSMAGEMRPHKMSSWVGLAFGISIIAQIILA